MRKLPVNLQDCWEVPMKQETRNEHSSRSTAASRTSSPPPILPWPVNATARAFRTVGISTSRVDLFKPHQIVLPKARQGETPKSAWARLFGEGKVYEPSDTTPRFTSAAV